MLLHLPNDILVLLWELLFDSVSAIYRSSCMKTCQKLRRHLFSPSALSKFRLQVSMMQLQQLKNTNSLLNHMFAHIRDFRVENASLNMLLTKALARMKNLTSLNLIFNKNVQKIRLKLPRLNNLRHLGVANYNITKKHSIELKKLPSLQSAVILLMNMDARTQFHLFSSTHLKKLAFFVTFSSQLIALTRFQQLEELSLALTPFYFINNQCKFEFLASLLQLRKLKVICEL